MGPFTAANYCATVVNRNRSTQPNIPNASQTPFPNPNEQGLTRKLLPAAQDMLSLDTPTNTRKTMIPKMTEIFKYCDEIYPNDPSPRHLTSEKVYRFMFYTAFREENGGSKWAGVTGLFDRTEYNKVIENFRSVGKTRGRKRPPETEAQDLREEFQST